jgi:hypothetical protein
MPSRGQKGNLKMAINTQTREQPGGDSNLAKSGQGFRGHGQSAGRTLLAIATGALVGLTIGLAALGAYAVLDDDGGASSAQPPSAPAPADPADLPDNVSDVSLFAEVGTASTDPRDVVQSILDSGGYAEGWTTKALYEREDLMVVAFSHPDNPPGSEFLNLYRLALGDDGLWHAFPGYDAVNGLYGTAEDAMFGYAIKNHSGAEINPDEPLEGAASVSWTVIEDNPSSRTYEVTATAAEPVTVVINQVSEVEAETGANIDGWRGSPPELFPY